MKPPASSPLVTFAALLLALPAAAAPLRIVSTSFDYSTGEYGGSTRSEEYAATLEFVRVFGSFELGVSRSYLHITNPGVSIPGVGPLQPEAQALLAAQYPRLAALLASRNASATTTTDESEEGFGDTLVHGAYTFESARVLGWIPSLSVGVKFGTADADKGLGTGETDYSVTARFAKNSGNHGANIAFGYQVLGDPDGLDLKNGAFATFSFWRDVTAHGTLSAGIDLCSATTEDFDGTASLFTRYTHHFSDKASASAGLGAGLTDSSPDFTGSLGFEYAF